MMAYVLSISSIIMWFPAEHVLISDLRFSLLPVLVNRSVYRIIVKPSESLPQETTAFDLCVTCSSYCLKVKGVNSAPLADKSQNIL